MDAQTAGLGAGLEVFFWATAAPCPTVSEEPVEELTHLRAERAGILSVGVVEVARITLAEHLERTGRRSILGVTDEVGDAGHAVGMADSDESAEDLMSDLIDVGERRCAAR